MDIIEKISKIESLYNNKNWGLIKRSLEKKSTTFSIKIREGVSKWQTELYRTFTSKRLSLDKFLPG